MHRHHARPENRDAGDGTDVHDLDGGHHTSTGHGLAAAEHVVVHLAPAPDGTRVISSIREVVGADEAREIYEEIVRTRRDPALLEYLREHEIHLEVCPSCNVYVDHRRFEAYGDHPVGALYDAGLSISVNSDVRTLVPVRPDEQYEQLHQVFGWDKEQFLRCNLNALKAAFLTEPVKAQLVERLLQGYQA